MGKVISIEAWRAKKLEKEVEDLALELDEMIKDLDVDMTCQHYYPYMNDTSTFYQHELFSLHSTDCKDPTPMSTLPDITDMLTHAMLSLDTLNHKGWADKVGDILGDIFHVKND